MTLVRFLDDDGQMIQLNPEYVVSIRPTPLSADFLTNIIVHGVPAMLTVRGSVEAVRNKLCAPPEVRRSQPMPEE